MEADNLLWQCQIKKKKKEKREKKQKALSIVGTGIMDMSEKLSTPGIKFIDVQ